MDKNLVTGHELEKLLNVSGPTINYYTNMGLFTVKDRRGNVRLYEKSETCELFEQIRKMRKEGYSLKIICKRLQQGYKI